MQIRAKVIQVLPLESGVGRSSGQPWSKATVIVETIEQYPKKIALSNMKNATGFSSLPPGAVFNFDIGVESREFNGRWYTEVTCRNWTNPH